MALGAVAAGDFGKGHGHGHHGDRRNDR